MLQQHLLCNTLETKYKQGLFKNNLKFNKCKDVKITPKYIVIKSCLYVKLSSKL